MLLLELTPQVVVCTVHHICSVDELVPRTPHTQLDLIVTQHHLPPV